MTTRRTWLRSMAVATATTLLSWPLVMASAASQQSFTITDPRVSASSGLARDTGSDLYWTANRSGDEGTAYGIKPDGGVQGVIGFRAEPKDVEAVAVYGSRLYVADIGDRGKSRKFVTVYYFNGAQADNKTVPYRSYDFRYPDGKHDAATLLVNPDGRLYLVTKEARGGIYAAPESPSRQGVNELTRVGNAPAFVTDGAFLPGGRQIALRTYVSVQVLDARSYRVEARAATPFQRQGESLGVTLDGRSLLVGSMGRRSSVLVMPIPTKLEAVPAAAATPPPSAQPTPTASSSADPDDSQDDPADEEQGAPTSRRGTVLALTLAALVAVAAGVVVVVRKP